MRFGSPLPEAVDIINTLVFSLPAIQSGLGPAMSTGGISDWGPLEKHRSDPYRRPPYRCHRGWRRPQLGHRLPVSDLWSDLNNQRLDSPGGKMKALLEEEARC
jgi:hypothetical protein